MQWNLAEIWDAGLQVHECTHDYQLDKVAGLNHQFTECGLYSIETTHWFPDVSHAYETEHLLHSEYTESVHVRSEAHTLGSCQTCTQICARYYH